MEHDFFKKYIDIINEASGPSASAAQLTPDQEERLDTQTDPDVASFYQHQQYGQTPKTFKDGGETTQVNKLTGIKTVSDETGTKTYDASGQLIQKSNPSLGGFSDKTDTRTGDTTKRFDAGDVGVSSTQTAGGYEKEKSSRYQMGDVGVAASQTAPDYAKGQLAAPTTSTASTSTGQQGTAVSGVGFGGASGKNVGNNTVTSGNQELADIAKMAAPQPGQQPVSEEEEPESVRDLLKKLLDIVRDHEGPKKDKKEEDSEEEMDEAKKDDSKESKTNTSTTKDNPSQYPTKTDIPKRDLPKNSSAVIGKEDDKEEDEEKVTEDENIYQREYQVAEEKIEESLRSLLKSIKEGK